MRTDIGHVISRLCAAGERDLYGRVWVGRDYSKADLVADLESILANAPDPSARQKRWREKNRDRYNAYAREYRRRKRNG